MDFQENFTTDVRLDKEVPTEFCIWAGFALAKVCALRVLFVFHVLSIRTSLYCIALYLCRLNYSYNNRSVCCLFELF